MRPHPRIRKTIKWGGLVVAALLVPVYLFSMSWAIGHANQPGLGVMASAGSFVLTWSTETTAPLGDASWFIKPVGRPGFGTNRPFLSVRMEYLFVFFMTASALAWRLDTVATRRLKLGACPTCSYPRTGLAPSSPCPECGSAAPRA